jgi:hypothetical protein
VLPNIKFYYNIIVWEHGIGKVKKKAKFNYLINMKINCHCAMVETGLFSDYADQLSNTMEITYMGFCHKPSTNTKTSVTD